MRYREMNEKQQQEFDRKFRREIDEELESYRESWHISDGVVLAVLIALMLLLSGCAVTITCPTDGCVFGGASASLGKPHPEQSPPGEPGQAVGVYRSEP